MEDEILLAMDLEGLLEDAGCVVLEPVGSLAAALKALDTQKPDLVSLDMNLNGQSSAPVAAKLQEQGVPFVVLTAYSSKHQEDAAFEGAPLVKKPYDSAEYIRVLTRLLG